MKVREVKDWYVDFLAEEIQKENRDLEELPAPLVVMASSTKDDSHMREKSSYTFQVVGGVHRYLTILKINEGKKKNLTRKCAIYGSGLSRNAILRLANQHNEVNKMQRATSLAEVAATCRRLMFIHFADDNMADDGSHSPNIPRYNTKKYHEWKPECMEYLSSPATVSSNVE